MVSKEFIEMAEKVSPGNEIKPEGSGLVLSDPVEFEVSDDSITWHKAEVTGFADNPSFRVSTKTDIHRYMRPVTEGKVTPDLSAYVCAFLEDTGLEEGEYVVSEEGDALTGLSVELEVRDSDEDDWKRCTVQAYSPALSWPLFSSDPSSPHGMYRLPTYSEEESPYMSAKMRIFIESNNIAEEDYTLHSDLSRLTLNKEIRMDVRDRDGEAWQEVPVTAYWSEAEWPVGSNNNCYRFYRAVRSIEEKLGLTDKDYTKVGGVMKFSESRPAQVRNSTRWITADVINFREGTDYPYGTCRAPSEGDPEGTAANMVFYKYLRAIPKGDPSVSVKMFLEMAELTEGDYVSISDTCVELHSLPDMQVSNDNVEWVDACICSFDSSEPYPVGTNTGTYRYVRAIPEEEIPTLDEILADMFPPTEANAEPGHLLGTPVPVGDREDIVIDPPTSLEVSGRTIERSTDMLYRIEQVDAKVDALVPGLDTEQLYSDALDIAETALDTMFEEYEDYRVRNVDTGGSESFLWQHPAIEEYDSTLYAAVCRKLRELLGENGAAYTRAGMAGGDMHLVTVLYNSVCRPQDL